MKQYFQWSMLLLYILLITSISYAADRKVSTEDKPVISNKSAENTNKTRSDKARIGKPDPLDTLLKFMSAFNQRDAKSMSVLLAEDVKWLSIVGDTVKVEIPNREELEAYLQKYFVVLPTVHSHIEATIVAGNYVSFKEKVSWQLNDVEKHQEALGVYEVREGKITRVWYYPEH